MKKMGGKGIFFDDYISKGWISRRGEKHSWGVKWAIPFKNSCILKGLRKDFQSQIFYHKCSKEKDLRNQKSERSWSNVCQVQEKVKAILVSNIILTLHWPVHEDHNVCIWSQFNLAYFHGNISCLKLKNPVSAH